MCANKLMRVNAFQNACMSPYLHMLDNVSLIIFASVKRTTSTTYKEGPTHVAHLLALSENPQVPA